MSALPAEKNEAVPEYMLAAVRWILGDPTIAMLPPEPTVQMKAAYFEEVPQTIDEMARKLLARVQGSGC